MSATAKAITFDISARVAEAVATLGLVPPALIGAIAERHYDFMNHHRRHVLKHHGFPAKRRAQKMLAARLHRYGTTARDNPVQMSDLVGESFAAGAIGGVQGWGNGAPMLLNWEQGATLTSREGMFIPFGAGVQDPTNPRGSRRSKAFVGLWQAGLFDITRRGVLVQDMLTRRRLKGYEGIAGFRTAIYGVIRKRRRQPAMLGFFKALDAIAPIHLAKYDQDVEKALTVAGRGALAARTLDAMNRDTRKGTWESGYRSELKRFLWRQRIDTDPLYKAMKEAREAVKADRVEKGGDDA